MIVSEAILKYEKKAVEANLEKSAVRILIAYLLKISINQLAFHLHDRLDEKAIENLFIQYQRGKPVQYLVSSTSFYNYDFYVDERVLIPRFETEELVAYALKEITNFFGDKVLKCCDIGVGSGAISITMMKENAKLHFTGIDISEEALQVAKINAVNHKVLLKLKRGSVFQPVLHEKFDVIISNPPYICKDEQIDERVFLNEPHEALFAEKDGLAIYEEILKKVSEVINKKALLFFEFGASQAPELEKLLDFYLDEYEYEIRKDLQGHNRMMMIKLMR